MATLKSIEPRFIFKNEVAQWLLMWLYHLFSFIQGEIKFCDVERVIILLREANKTKQRVLICIICRSLLHLFLMYTKCNLIVNKHLQ